MIHLVPTIEFNVLQLARTIEKVKDFFRPQNVRLALAVVGMNRSRLVCAAADDLDRSRGNKSQQFMVIAFEPWGGWIGIQ